MHPWNCLCTHQLKNVVQVNLEKLEYCVRRPAQKRSHALSKYHHLHLKISLYIMANIENIEALPSLVFHILSVCRTVEAVTICCQSKFWFFSILSLVSSPSCNVLQCSNKSVHMTGHVVTRLQMNPWIRKVI